MKIFCTNAFTGEDVDVVTKRMKLVIDQLNKVGHQAYCPIFDPHKIELQSKGDVKEIFNYAFKNLLECDAMVAIITSGRKSEGQLMEAGAALAAGKPLFVFIHKSAKDKPTHLKTLAGGVYYWSDNEELIGSLSELGAPSN